MSTKPETKPAAAKSETAPAVTLRVVMVALKDIDPHAYPEPVRLRPENEESEEFRSLVDAVKRDGVRVPLELAPCSKAVPRKLGIVAGRRRYKAAIKAGLTFVPAVIVDKLSGQDAAPERVRATITENAPRRNYHYVEEALSVARRMLAGEKQADIALSMGKSVPTVSNLGRIGRAGYAGQLEKRFAADKPVPAWRVLIDILEHCKDEPSVEARGKAELKAFDEACAMLDGISARVAPPVPEAGSAGEGSGEGSGEGGEPAAGKGGGATGGIPVRNGKVLNAYLKALEAAINTAPADDKDLAQLQGAAAAIKWAMYAGAPADRHVKNRDNKDAAPYIDFVPAGRGAPKKEKPAAAEGDPKPEGKGKGKGKGKNRGAK